MPGQHDFAEQFLFYLAAKLGRQSFEIPLIARTRLSHLYLERFGMHLATPAGIEFQHPLARTALFRNRAHQVECR